MKNPYFVIVSLSTRTQKLSDQDKKNKSSPDANLIFVDSAIVFLLNDISVFQQTSKFCTY